MSQPQKTTSVTILNKEYLIACDEGEEERLQRSASYIHKKMCELRDSGKVLGSERIAIMVSLNLAHEHLMQEDYIARLEESVSRVSRQVTAALGEAKEEGKDLDDFPPVDV